MIRHTLTRKRIKLNRYRGLLEEKMMNLRLKSASAVLLLLLGVASAFAEPGNRRSERAAQREEQRQARQDQAQRNSVPDAAPEEPRRKGNMTREERRALRQQINDAGRDIYRPPN